MTAVPSGWSPEQARKRLEAATPGPWRVILPSWEGPDRRKYRCVEFDRDGYTTSPLTPADARLIAHAPTDIAALLALLDDAREALDEFAAYDWHATQWIAGVQHDGHDLRALLADDVESLKRTRGKARAFLARFAADKDGA